MRSGARRSTPTISRKLSAPMPRPPNAAAHGGCTTGSSRRRAKCAGSPELARLFGQSADFQLSVTAAKASIEPEDWSRLVGAAFAAMARGERFFESEFRYHLPSGEQRWFMLRGEMMLTPDNKPLRT